MIGQGPLRERLLAGDVERMLPIARSPVGRQHDKLRELVHHDFMDFSAIQQELAGYACIFCLGVSAARMREPDYRRVTYEFTLAAAGTLAGRNPGMTFVYVSGQGTDSSGQARAMWARDPRWPRGDHGQDRVPCTCTASGELYR